MFLTNIKLFTANCFYKPKRFIRQAPVVGQVAVGDRAHHVEELLVPETKPGADVIKLFLSVNYGFSQ